MDISNEYIQAIPLTYTIYMVTEASYTQSAMVREQRVGGLTVRLRHINEHANE